MSKNSTTPAVFLSHASADKSFVRILAVELRKNGISCWVDEAEIHYGESLVQKISDAIEHIALVLAVISKNSVNSSWVRQELDWAMSKEIKQRRVVIIPVVIDQCDVPFFLMNKLYADFTEPGRFPDTTARLVESILHHSGQPHPAVVETLLGESVAPPYRPTSLPLFIDIALLAFSGVLCIFPSLSMIYPTDPARNDWICAAMRGFGLLMGAGVLMDVVRIGLVRYMMRENANFARASADVRWSGFPCARYRRLVRHYWSYPLVKILVSIEAGTTIVILFMVSFVVRIAISVLK